MSAPQKKKTAKLPTKRNATCDTAMCLGKSAAQPHDTEWETIAEYLVAISCHREIIRSEDGERLVKHNCSGDPCNEDVWHKTFHGARPH